MSNLEKSKKLYHLCKTGGELSEIQNLINEGADVNYSCLGYGFTPLHWAAHYANAPLIGLLMFKGANPNAYSYNVKTPLDEAIARHGRKEIIDLLRSYGCHKAESKGIYFTRKVTEEMSPFMLDDMCIMKAFCGDGFKLYAAKSDSPATVNFYGDDEKAPKLIGCIDKSGEIILTKEFSELYFPVREKAYLHEYVYRFNRELKEAVMEKYKDSVFPKTNFSSFCARNFHKARKTAILGDAKATGYDMSVDITLQMTAELLCGKMSVENLLAEIETNFKLKNETKEYVGFVNACKARFANEIEPYEYAIANAVAPYSGLEEFTVYRKDEEEACYSKNAITRTCDWWENIDRIEKDGRVLYDFRDYEKENIER